MADKGQLAIAGSCPHYYGHTVGPLFKPLLLLSQPLHFGDYGKLPLKVLWALLDLLTIAVLFLRNQIRPILKLADAAEAFGKGRDAADQSAGNG